MADIGVIALKYSRLTRLLKGRTRDFDVVTRDGHKIGKIDEATNEVGSSWVVVDTGFWIFGKKRMIPAGTIQSLDVDNGEGKIDMTETSRKPLTTIRCIVATRSIEVRSVTTPRSSRRQREAARRTDRAPV